MTTLSDLALILNPVFLSLERSYPDPQWCIYKGAHMHGFVPKLCPFC